MEEARSHRRGSVPSAGRAGLLHRGIFALSLLVLSVSFAMGFVRSAQLFGLPPIRGDATILGNFYFQNGDYARGLDEYRLAGLIDPANYSPDPELDFRAAPPADPAARIAGGRRRVQLRPDAPDAHLALGVALLQAGENRAGLESLERARELDRSTPGLAAALGHAHVRLSNPSEAVPLFFEALEREPDNADLREALALALYRLGLREEAVEQFELARIQRSESRSAR